MKQKQAQALRARWGDAPCEHPALAREYDQAGERTGSFICTQCGRTLTFEERTALKSSRR
jgi:transposase-like protein